MIKTDTGIITIAVDITPAGLLRISQAIFSALMVICCPERTTLPNLPVSLQTGRNNGKVCPTFPRPDVRHVAAPTWFGSVTANCRPRWFGIVTFHDHLVYNGAQAAGNWPVPVFHEPAGKPAPHSEASQGCHWAMLLAPAEPWLMLCNSSTWRVIQPVCRLVFQDGFSSICSAAMNPEHMAECDHRIMRSEFPIIENCSGSLTSRAR